MKTQLWYLCIVLMAGLAGCQSERAPSFVSSDALRDLIPAAQTVTVDDVNRNFGTPSDLVVATYLDIDFGTYTGTVVKVLPQEGSYKVRLNPQSSLADASRLSEIRGAAVTISSPAASEAAAPAAAEADAAEVAEPAKKDAAGEEAAAAEPATQLQVVSFAPGEQQAGEEGVVGALQIATADGSPVSASVSEGDVVTIQGDTLQRGRNLYLRHCMHCHGVSGDGNGPTAEYFTIKPRDYRQGVFKFTSTVSGRSATRDDLKRIIKLGIPGTYMPSFMLLPDDETDVIVEYVRWLAMRGQMENKYFDRFAADYRISERIEDQVKQAVLEAIGNEKPLNSSQIESKRTELNEAVQKEFEEDWADIAQQTRDKFEQDLAAEWAATEDEQSVVLPAEPRKPPTPESIANGRKLFLSDDAACYTCHGKLALGNGESTTTYSKDKNDKEYDTPGLFDDWGNPLKPRNLTSGVYRGGRRPIDIYRRIFVGIKGARMPGLGKPEGSGEEDAENAEKTAQESSGDETENVEKKPGESGEEENSSEENKDAAASGEGNGSEEEKKSLTPGQIWDLVNYVLSIPVSGAEPGAKH